MSTGRLSTRPRRLVPSSPISRARPGARVGPERTISRPPGRSPAPSRQQAVSGYLGEKLVNTFFDGDSSNGTITSPTFTITSNYIDMLIGGGNHPYTGPDPRGGQRTDRDQPPGRRPGGAVSNRRRQRDAGLVVLGRGPPSGDSRLSCRSSIKTPAAGVTSNVDHIVFADEPGAKRNIETTVNLLVNNTVVKTVTGPNSESLDWASFDLADYSGQNAQIQVVDNNTAGWGHILADQFYFAAEPARSSIQRASWMDWGSDFYAATTVNDGTRWQADRHRLDEQLELRRQDTNLPVGGDGAAQGNSDRRRSTARYSSPNNPRVH